MGYLSVIIQSEPSINLALYRCNHQLAVSVRIENLGPEPAVDLCLIVRAESSETSKYFCTLPTIQGFGTQEVQCKNIHPNAIALSSINERYESCIYAEVYSRNDLVAFSFAPIMIDPIYQWIGDSEPLSLAPFVMPNHPCLAPVRIATARAFERLGNNPCLNGYKGNNCSIALSMVEAAFHAMCEQEIVFSNAPISFGGGQRIRPCKEVLDQKLGTCIDLALLLLSLLESIHLNTVLLVSNAHCWAGVWLTNTHSRQALNKRTKSFAEQIKQGNAIAIECTGFTKENTRNFGIASSIGQAEQTRRMSLMFKAALAVGNENMAAKTGFRYFIDIACAHERSGVEPLPF